MSISRRKLLWSTPVITCVVLPSHAQTSSQELFGELEIIDASFNIFRQNGQLFLETSSITGQVISSNNIFPRGQISQILLDISDISSVIQSSTLVIAELDGNGNFVTFSNEDFLLESDETAMFATGRFRFNFPDETGNSEFIFIDNDLSQ